MNRVKSYTKAIGYLMVAVLVPVLVSGCSLRGGDEEKEVKSFTIWAFDDEDVWKPVIRDAEKALKGYEVKYVKKELSSNYENDALNSILSGSGPDIWAIPSDWVYRHKNKLAPMPDKQAEKINLDDSFVPVVKQVGYFDDKIYSLAPTVDTLMTYYNPAVFSSTLEEYNKSHRGMDYSDARKSASKLLSQVPVTWSDFTESSKLITKRNGNNIERSGVAMGTANNVSQSSDVLYALMLQNQTQMTSTDLSTAIFNLTGNDTNSPASRALDFYSSFADPASPNYSWNSNMSSDIESFVNGQTAMVFGYESLANYFTQIYPNFKFRKAPFPQIGGTDETIKDFASYTTYVVPKLSQNSDTAWSLISTLSSGSNSSYSSTVKITSSAKKKNFEAKLIDREGNTNPGRLQTQTASLWIKGRFPDQADTIFDAAIDNKAQGKQDTRSALDLAASRITDLLRKDGW